MKDTNETHQTVAPLGTDLPVFIAPKRNNAAKADIPVLDALDASLLAHVTTTRSLSAIRRRLHSHRLVKQ